MTACARFLKAAEDKDVRKLQALTFMNRHNLRRVPFFNRIFNIACGNIALFCKRALFLFPQRSKLIDKPRRTFSGGIAFPRKLKQQVKLFPQQIDGRIRQRLIAVAGVVP